MVRKLSIALGALMAASVMLAQRTEKAERRPIVFDPAPVRSIQDPYSVFNGIAMDVERGEIFAADDNLSSISIYRTQFAPSDRITEPLRRIQGPKTRLGFVCGVTVSPEHREIYAVSGDDDYVTVFPLEARGERAPLRVLDQLEHGTVGIFLDRKNDELFITIEHSNKVYVHRRTAKSGDPPIRFIQGPKTGLADPHGLFVDEERDEIYVSNHGHWQRFEAGERYMESAEDPNGPLPLGLSTGKFLPPSIMVYPRAGHGDVAPLRAIQGSRTGLNLPLGMYLDPISNQIAVINSGDSSLLFFDRDATGNVAPVRTVKGTATGLAGPAGIFIDAKRNEIWVSNWDNHTASVYPRTAQGNAAPLRVVRSAPKSAAGLGFGNIGDVAFDPKRQEILVPN